MSFNFIELQKKRIYSQYKDKPKAVKWYLIYPTIATQFATIFALLKDSYDLRSVKNEYLNIIGRIVDQSRNFTAENAQVIVEVSFFSPLEKDDLYSLDAINAEYFGDEEVQFSPITMPYEGFLPDNAYSQAIQSKIIKNASTVTIDETIEAIKLVVGKDVRVTLTDNFNMSFSILVQGEVTDYTNFALTTDLISNRPQGVKFLGYLSNIVFFIDIDSETEQEAFYFGDESAQFSGFTGGEE